MVDAPQERSVINETMRIYEIQSSFDPPRETYTDSCNGGNVQTELCDRIIEYSYKTFRVMSDSIQPHEHDVLMGRGGKNNQHAGNERLRHLARLYCDQYKRSKKTGKSVISRQLVLIMRSLNPPGRFLKKDLTSGEWEDVGDETAREKASQVLRDAVSSQSEGRSRCSSLYAVPSLDETSGSSFDGIIPAIPSESFPPPTPIQTRCKRVRVGSEDATPPRPPPMRLDAASFRRHTDGADTHLSQHPPARLTADGRNSSTATAGSLLGELHADVHSTMLSEFDLFNGELLDTGTGDANAPISYPSKAPRLSPSI